MKRFISALSIFLILLITINTVNVAAYPESFSQGFYSVKDLHLMENVNYAVQNISPNYDAYLIIFDDQERTNESVRLGPHSQKHILLPVKYNYKILIIGNGELTFS